jgi:hypothetical protein
LLTLAFCFVDNSYPSKYEVAPRFDLHFLSD